MPESITEYTPVHAALRSRGLAVRTWLYGSAFVLGWLGLTVVPAVAKVNGLEAVASPLYTLFSYLCHQIPDRSFHLAGEQFGVCSRCFGVYFGLASGFVVYPLWRDVADVDPLPRVWLFLSMIPIGVDWSLTVFGVWENTHLSRFVTGAILGFACGSYIVPAVVEIVRNMRSRRTIPN